MTILEEILGLLSGSPELHAYLLARRNSSKPPTMPISSPVRPLRSRKRGGF